MKNQLRQLNLKPEEWFYVVWVDPEDSENSTTTPYKVVEIDEENIQLATHGINLGFMKIDELFMQRGVFLTKDPTQARELINDPQLKFGKEEMVK